MSIIKLMQNDIWAEKMATAVIVNHIYVNISKRMSKLH